MPPETAGSRLTSVDMSERTPPLESNVHESDRSCSIFCAATNAVIVCPRAILLARTRDHDQLCDAGRRDNQERCRDDHLDERESSIAIGSCPHHAVAWCNRRSSKGRTDQSGFPGHFRRSCPASLAMRRRICDAGASATSHKLPREPVLRGKGNCQHICLAEGLRPDS